MPTPSLLRGPAALLTGLVLTSALAACSSAGGTSTDTDAPASDTVRVAVLGSPSDTLDITQAATQMPFTIGLNVFDSLVVLRGGELELQLAETAEPNADATAWTFTIRDGVTFHDGSAVTADDVLYSLQYIGTSAAYGSIYSDVDWAASTSDGDRTVTLALTRPRADLLEAMAQVNMVFPDGTTDEGIGSGPYQVESFSADTGAVLVANEDYWGGAPFIQEIDVLPVADAGARLSALTGGQADYVVGLTPAGAETLPEDAGLVVDSGGLENSSALMFTMNTSIAPFDDPEVRTAFKEVVDRQQLVDVVMRGQGEVGDDMVGKGLPGYDTDLAARTYDADAAAEVFAAHGVADLGIVVAEMIPGLTDATTLLQQQLADAGVTLTITEADPTTLYSDLSVVYGSQLFATYVVNRPVASHLPTFTSADSPYNFSQWKDAEYTELLNLSQSTVDPDERQQVLDQAQQRAWAQGGDVVWAFQPDLVAHVDTLAGVELSQSVPVFADAEYDE